MPRGLVETFAAAVLLSLMVSAAFVLDVSSDNPGWYAIPIGLAVICGYVVAALTGQAMRRRSW